jgi:diguanylate cyclase (GGDEF)-like protein
MTEITQKELLAKKLADLCDSYAHSLPHKMQDIGHVLELCLQPEPDSSQFLILNRLLHTLAGSAGTFGFSALGQVAGRLEGRVHVFIHQDPGEPIPFAPLAGEIRELLRWTLIDPQHPPALPVPDEEAAEPSGVVVPIRDTLLLYVFDVAPGSSYLLSQLENYGYHVKLFFEVATLARAIAERVPAVLVVDMASDFSALAQLQASLAKRIPAIYLAQDTAFAHRLAAAVADADGYFVKPVDIVALNVRIDALVRQLEKLPYRILIVDDDVFVADFYAANLRSAGMEVCSIQDPADIFMAMAEFKPELLLMDVFMPSCSGVQLAKIVRQEAAYLDVPIVYLSTESDLGRQLDAISAGADDFLTKPMSAPYLISSLTSRVERYRSLRDLILRDSLTMLYNHSTIKEQAALEIERARRHGKPLTLAMLDLDYFKNVNDNYGHQVGDNVIRSLAQMLQKTLRRVDIIGRYGGEEFAVIFPETSMQAALVALEKVRAGFAKIKHHSMDHQWQFEVTLSGGVVELSKNVDVSLFFEQADIALYAAKHGGRNRIRQYLEGK